jgi:hypothetical protein
MVDLSIVMLVYQRVLPWINLSLTLHHHRFGPPQNFSWQCMGKAGLKTYIIPTVDPCSKLAMKKKKWQIISVTGLEASSCHMISRHHNKKSMFHAYVSPVPCGLNPSCGPNPHFEWLTSTIGWLKSRFLVVI